MKSFITIYMLLAATLNVFATAQVSDTIFYKGKKYSLHTNPMKAFFEKHPDKKPDGGVMSSANWRGYIATFTIMNQTMQLRDIGIQIRIEKEKSEYPYEWKSVLNELVPKGETLTIDWFTGILVLPDGELVRYVHMGYGSTYENYILLEVKSGKVTGKREFDHKQYELFKAYQFAEYKKTDEYRASLNRLTKNDREKEQTEKFLRQYKTQYTSEFLDECPDYQADVQVLQAYDALGEDAKAKRLVQLIFTGSEEIRVSILHDLNNLNISKYRHLITPLLTHEDSDVQILVARLFSKRGNEACVPALIDALQDENPRVRQEIASALRSQEHPDIDEALIKLVSDESRTVRVTALVSLSSRKCTEAIPAYYAGLKDPDPVVRRKAINALERVGCVEAVPDILKCLEDPKHDVRKAVIDVLSDYIRSEEIKPDATLVTAIEHCLYDDNARVRVAAAQFFCALGNSCGLKKIQNRELIELRILEIMQSTDHDRQLNRAARAHQLCRLAYVLEDIGSSKAQPCLVTLLSHEDKNVRQSASSALGEIGNSDALPKLKAQLAIEESDWVRESLSRAIKRLQERIAKQ